MTPSVLILLATLLTVDGDRATINKGYSDGVRAGDTGQLFYTLQVGPQKTARRIDVGPVEILEVGASSAEFTIPVDLKAHPGYSLEIEIPRSRFHGTDEILRLARQHLKHQRFDQALQVLETAEQVQQIVPGDASARAHIDRLKAEIDRRRTAKGTERANDSNADSRTSPKWTLSVRAGSYDIGVDLDDARFHNQYPRFQAEVRRFQIDRRPIAAADFLAVYPEHAPEHQPTTEHGLATEVTFDVARDYCHRLGMRLPTEFEWEIAAQDPDFASRAPIHEWTSSWYQPYPGNEFPDKDYGESFRVLKGGQASASEAFDSRLRRFLPPDASHPNVGFRCVFEPDAAPAP